MRDSKLGIANPSTLFKLLKPSLMLVMCSEVEDCLCSALSHLQEKQRKYAQLSGPDKATLVLVSAKR